MVLLKTLGGTDPVCEQHLVLIPGLACDATVWTGVIRSLGSGFLTMVPDLRECGSLDEMADAVLAAAAPRFAVAGHSMGARVALEVALKAPDRVTRLALLSTSVEPVTEAEISQRRRLVRLARDGGMPGVFSDWLRPLLSPPFSEDETVLGALEAMCCRSSPAIFEAHIEATLKRKDRRVALAGLTAPTLVLGGTEDRWSPPEQHQALASRIPGARLVLVPAAGHMVTVESPAAVAREISRWCAAADSAAR